MLTALQERLARRLNRRMVRKIWQGGSLRSPELRRALLELPRHLFLSKAYVSVGVADYLIDSRDESWRSAFLRFVYQGNPVATRKDAQGRGWTSSCSAPSMVSRMLDILAVGRGAKALEIGAGTGWNAALLTRLTGDPRLVYSMDIQRGVLRAARRHLAGAGIRGVRLLEGDGRGGFPAGAPYDRIIVTAAAPTVFGSLAAQLREGGRMVLPFEIGGINTPILWLDKRGGRLAGGFSDHAEFMPMAGRPTRHAGLSEPARKALHRFTSAGARLRPVPWEGDGARDDWARRYNFLFFLHLVEPKRACGVYSGGSNWENAVGLWDRRGRSLALITGEHLEAYGGAWASRRLLELYRRWRGLGSPAIHQFSVELAPAASRGGPCVGRIERPGAVLLLRLPAAVLALALFVFPARAEGAEKTRWKLLQEENFDRPVNFEGSPWIRDGMGPESPWYAGPLSDGGTFFHMIGGEPFKRQLESFWLYRKRIAFGADDWLTLELAARDKDKDGRPENPPALAVARVGERGPAGVLSEPDHNGGILIRNSRPLPARYRIEYELVALDFGGSRYDQWNSSGRVNGYGAAGPKTLHPWPWGPDQLFSLPYESWTDIRGSNGFYYLAIVDYPDPAPHNNVFIHTRRKVVMDSYNVPEGSFDACNPATGEFYRSQDNAVAAFFAIPGSKLESKAAMKTECGTVYGGEGGRSPYVAAVQLAPELLPKQSYRFAVERDRTGYTLEMSGNFRFAGQRTFRYHRYFVEDGRAIWHYNQTATEYDGAFDELWSYAGPFGGFSEHSWPKGSSYPDYFIIGDPHLNFYEGSAAIDELRLYVPAD